MKDDQKEEQPQSNEDSTTKKKLTHEQEKELMSYPPYWRGILRIVAERGGSMKEKYKELEELEYTM